MLLGWIPVACGSEGGGANRPGSALRPRWNSRLSSRMQPHPAAVSDGVTLKHCSVPWRHSPGPAIAGAKSRSTPAGFVLLLKVLNSREGLGVHKLWVFDVRGG